MSIKTGLRQRPTYNQLIEEIQLDEKIRLPNRQAKFLRESPYLAFLDEGTYAEMEEQQYNTQKQIQVEHTIRQQAAQGNDTASELRVKKEMKDSASQVERMLSSSGAQTDAPDDMDGVVTGGGQPPPPPPGAGAVGARGDWNPSSGWLPPGDPWMDWMTNKHDGGQPPPPPPPPPATVVQNIHVPHSITNIHTDPHLVHTLTLNQALHQMQIQKIAGLVANHLGSEQEPQQANNFAAKITAMDTTIGQHKRQAEAHTAAASRARASPPPDKTPAPTPTVQPEPTPTVNPPPATPMDSSTGQVKRKEDGKGTGQNEKKKKKEKQKKEDKGDKRKALESDVAPNIPKAKAKAKAKTQDMTEEEQKLFDEIWENIGKSAAKTKGKAEPKPEPSKKVVPNPLFQKKAQPNANPKTGYVDHGTEKDASTSKAHWDKKPLAYIKDQLEKRGFAFDKSRFRGKGALNKSDLLRMLYRADKIN